MRTWCLAGLAFLAFDVRAQSHGVEPVRFVNLSTAQGLSQPTVRVLIQDSTGFLWMGTQDGLNRYDGNGFRVFLRDADDAHTLGDNHITALAAARDGDLWVGTQAGGLGYYDASMQQFDMRRHRPDDDHGLAGNPITALLAEPDGRLWVASGNGALQWTSTQDARFRAVPAAKQPAGVIRALLRRADGSVYVGARRGLRLVSAAGETLGELRDDQGVAPDVHALAGDQQGRLWVATAAEGLWCFDAHGAFVGRWRREQGLSDDALRAVLVDRRGRVWIATAQGLNRLEADGRTLRSWLAQSGSDSALAANRLQSLLEDRDGSIWIGTWINGVSHFLPVAEAFVEVRALADDERALSPGAMTAVRFDGTHALWVGGTDGGGLSRIDLAQGVTTRYRADTTRVDALRGEYVSGLARDARGALWLASVGGGVARMRPDGTGFDYAGVETADADGIGSAMVKRVLFDRDGGLWLGTADAGVRWRCATCPRFVALGTPAGATDSENVEALYSDGDGSLWVGMSPGGLLHVGARGELLERMRGEGSPGAVLSHDRVTAVVRDDAGRLWVGTQGGGVNIGARDETGAWRFRAVTRAHGLAADAIGAIVADNDGRMWVSTTVGISSIERERLDVRNYGARDGALQGGYIIGAFAQSDDGRIAFGGMNGLTVFDPREIAPDLAPLRVAIVEARLLGQSLDSRASQMLAVQRRAQYEYSVRLPEGRDDIAVEFAALQFAHPQNVRYAYRLSDIDEHGWVHADARQRVASYSNLLPGDYTLSLRASLGRDALGEPTLLRIHVPAPLWWTRSAKAAYWAIGLLVLASLGWLAWRRGIERAQATRRLAQSEDRLKLALWGSGDELWDIDLRSMEIVRNNPMDRIAIPRDAYLPDFRSMASAMHSDDRAAFDRAFADHVRGVSDVFEATYRVRDGQGGLRWVRSRGRVVRRDAQGRALRMVGTTEDITLLKEHEQALERINTDLEQRVGDRTADLTVANENLRQTIERLRLAQGQLVESEKMAALGGLVAGIAHEINTPLGVGVTAASHLDAEAARMVRAIETTSPEPAQLDAFARMARETSQLILRNLQRADKLIKSFKQVAVDQSSEQRRRIDLRAYLDEVLTSLAPMWRKTPHQVTVSCPPGIVLDTYPGAIYQIIVNLLTNSLTHGFDGIAKGSVVIEVGIDADAVLLTYRDNGRGMTEDVRRRMFEPFFTTRRGHGGSGLGMHIAYNLATQLLRGSISCESAPAQGIKVMLRVPLM
jgi:ligand-binding sensor domain-containing protein/signal transduction histidine kinase